jgi:hypothetical protein
MGKKEIRGERTGKYNIRFHFLEYAKREGQSQESGQKGSRRATGTHQLLGTEGRTRQDSKIKTVSEGDSRPMGRESSGW